MINSEHPHPLPKDELKHTLDVHIDRLAWRITWRVGVITAGLLAFAVILLMPR